MSADPKIHWDDEPKHCNWCAHSFADNESCHEVGNDTICEQCFEKYEGLKEKING